MNIQDKEHLQFLPVSLNITNKKILIVGGGRIAFHKILLLSPFTNSFTVVAPYITEEIRTLRLTMFEREYQKEDLADHFLVYACTNIPELNRQVKSDANGLGMMANVVDNPVMCDFVSPAIYKNGHYTVAVSSNARNVKMSIKIRDYIKSILDHDFSKIN